MTEKRGQAGRSAGRRKRRAPTRAPRSEPEAVVVGAGPAGLGAARELSRRGVEVVILERARAVGESWRRRYEGLRLNTARSLSGLPGEPIPRRAGRWPSREDFVSYLERFAERSGIEIRFDVVVERIEREGEMYRLETSRGHRRAAFVVVATGYDREAVVPRWPGRETFTGELLHASRYRSPERFRGMDVLVVGMGNTGSEIAVQLLRAGAERVHVSMRTPPNIMPREFLGIPATVMARLSELQPAALVDRAGFVLQRLAWGDLSRHGLPRAPYGIATELRVKGLGAVLDSGLVAALKRGDLRLVRAVERFDGPDVVFAGGGRLRPQVVIAATGYRHGLERLVGHLGVLTPSGKPAVLGARTHPRAPRLYFNGYHLPLSGQLPAMRRTSRQIGRAVGRARRRRTAGPYRRGRPRRAEQPA